MAMIDGIDMGLIDYLEGLSYLTLSDEEKRRLAGDLEKILSYMERLGELDTDGVPERSHPFDDVNAFREDEMRPSCDRGLILQNAPDKDEEMFIAPRTVA
jgi:aspartyl-tRNA(Asn)/glutamyl-tRNA(Gln) amidotransferase subunit C